MKRKKNEIELDLDLEKKAKLKFKGRKQSGRGVSSLVLAIAVLVTAVAAFVYSAACKGRGGVVVGWMGLGAFVLSVPGIILGIKALKEQDIVLFPPIFGLVVNSLMMFALLVLYLIGMFSM